MKIRSPLRRAIALIALAMLVFLQGAMAAHLCADPTSAPVAPAHTSGMPCHGFDDGTAPPCSSHCEDSTQNIDQWASLAFVAPFTPPFIAVVRVMDARGQRPGAPDPSLLHPTSPPLTIRNCCFRN